eukprot:154656-Pelagomonas_calceolata.AAC.1
MYLGILLLLQKHCKTSFKSSIETTPVLRAGFMPLKETLASLTASSYDGLLTITSIKLRCVHSPEVPATSVPLLAHAPAGTTAKLFSVAAITMLLPSKDIEAFGNS